MIQDIFQQQETTGEKAADAVSMWLRLAVAHLQASSTCLFTFLTCLKLK